MFSITPQVPIILGFFPWGFRAIQGPKRNLLKVLHQLPQLWPCWIGWNFVDVVPADPWCFIDLQRYVYLMYNMRKNICLIMYNI